MITVTDAELADLRQRLAATRWPAQWPGMQPRGWVAGVPATELRRLTTAWGNGYDWRRHEAEINALPWGGDAQDAFTVIIPCLNCGTG